MASLCEDINVDSAAETKRPTATKAALNIDTSKPSRAPTNGPSDLAYTFANF
jgi:hypothetical protein